MPSCFFNISIITNKTIDEPETALMTPLAILTTTTESGERRVKKSASSSRMGAMKE